MYYYECPACGNVHDFVPGATVKYFWFDGAKVTQEQRRRLRDGDPCVRVELPERSWGEVEAPAPLPERTCHECGDGGCSDCIPDEVCQECIALDDEADEFGYCSPGCIACLNNWSHR
jgi:hypothetical protein